MRLRKRTIPISILTAENTIFIKTNQNKLTSNYLRNGNQIKQNKNISTTINQTQKLNNSLKNTFTLRKSNLITKLDMKNLNDLNNKLIEILKNKKIQKNYINPLASPSAGAPALKYGDIKSVTPSPVEVKGLMELILLLNIYI